MKRKTMLETFHSPQELSVMQRNWGSSQVEDNELLSDLTREQMVLMVDWAGESGKYEIGTFLQRRLDRLSNGDGLPMLNQENVYLELEKQRGFDRGDAVPFILNHFEKGLKKRGFSISLLQLGQDAYYIVLSTATNAKKLRKQKDDFWKFISLAQQSGEVLYVVDCPDCGGPSIWQLKRTSPPPSNERCENCGKLLFDEAGNALVKVVLEYI